MIHLNALEENAAGLNVMRESVSERISEFDRASYWALYPLMQAAFLALAFEILGGILAARYGSNSEGGWGIVTLLLNWPLVILCGVTEKLIAWRIRLNERDGTSTPLTSILAAMWTSMVAMLLPNWILLESVNVMSKNPSTRGLASVMAVQFVVIPIFGLVGWLFGWLIGLFIQRRRERRHLVAR